MSKLLLMRNTPMPLRAIVQILRARLQSRVEGQGDAARQDDGGQDDVELERGHAAAPKILPLAHAVGEDDAGQGRGAMRGLAPLKLVEVVRSAARPERGPGADRSATSKVITSIAQLAPPHFGRAFSRMGK